MRHSRHLSRPICIRSPPAKARSQYIELAAISQRGGLDGVRSRSVSGSNSRSKGFPGCATSGPEQVQQKSVLFDNLVGACEQRGRYIESERVGSRQIDDEIELGRLLDRDFAGLRSPKNLVHEVAGVPPQVRKVWPI